MVRPEKRAAGARLYLGDLRSVRVRAVRSPQFSTIHWTLAQAATDRARGSSTSIARAPGTRAAWAALGMPGLDRLPDFVMPAAPLDASVSDQTARLRDSPAAELAERIYELWGRTPPRPWQRAADRPKAWLESFCQLTLDVWARSAVRWHSGQRLIDREISRIGSAVVTDSMDVLLNSLHRRARYRDGFLEFDSFCDRSFDIRDRELVLVPMLAKPDQLAVSFGHPRYAFFAYPLRGRTSGPGLDSRGRRDDPLAILLGPIRAAAVRALDDARTMTELASELYCAPSTATYHCKYLEDAGLVVRERSAQTVWVRRTQRADELIELFGAS